MLKTLEEYLKYGELPDELRRLLDVEISEKIELEKEVSGLRKENELAWEAVSFARDNFEALESKLKQVTSAKQARESFVMVMENGYFEM